MVSGAGFLRGKPVYGQGSFAPNRGQVSAQGAQGYLQRELNKRGTNNGGPSRFAPHPGVSRFGQDGQSDTRSGAAASMLKQGLGNRPGPNDPLEPNRPKDPLNPDSGPKQPGIPPPPTVTINEAGQLELPYTDNWSEQLLTGLRDMNTNLLELQMGQQEQDLEFSKLNREADSLYGTAKATTLNQNAAAGMAFSSQYGTAVGRNATEYNNQKQDLLAQDSLFDQQVNAERMMIQNAFQDMLRTEVLNKAEEDAENAGSLGYGKDTPKLHPNQNTGVRADGKRRRNRRNRKSGGHGKGGS
jgi:hypothetical protein